MGGAWVGVYACNYHTPTTSPPHIIHPDTTHAPTHATTHAWPGLPINQIPNPVAGNRGAFRLHDTAAVTFHFVQRKIRLKLKEIKWLGSAMIKRFWQSNQQCLKVEIMQEAA